MKIDLPLSLTLAGSHPEMRVLYLLTIGDVQVLQSLLDRARKLKKIHGQNILSRTMVLKRITTARMMHFLPMLSNAQSAQRYSLRERSTRNYIP
jgi:hypothetical protein